jgi:opacity protein-like surface antigen
MKKITLIFSLLLSQLSFASDGFDYFGTSLQRGSYEETGLSTINPTSVKFSAGKYLAKNIAIEGQFILGLSGDTAVVEGVDVELELKNAISLFGKAEFPVNSNVMAYGLLGLTKGKLEANFEYQGTQFETSESDSGLSYGLGGSMKMKEGTNLTAEYISYLDEDEYEYSAINIGLNVNF